MPAIDGSPFTWHCSGIVRLAQNQLSQGQSLTVEIEFKPSPDALASESAKAMLTTLRRYFAQPFKYGGMDFEFKAIHLRNSSPVLMEVSISDLENKVVVEGGINHGYDSGGEMDSKQITQSCFKRTTTVCKCIGKVTTFLAGSSMSSLRDSLYVHPCLFPHCY
jgi:hypothetical protein